MKKTYFILAIMTLVLFSCGQKGSKTASDPDATTKEMAKELADAKTYYIAYKTVLGAQGMKTETLSKHWVDIKNDKMVIESETKSDMNGQKSTQSGLVISKDGVTYIINLADKTGMKMSDEDEEDSDDPANDIKPEDEETFRQSIEKEGGKIIGNETFLGKNCIVVKMNSEGETMKMWYYKGIPLKMESPMYTMEATEFNESISIPKSKFEVPEGIKIRELPNF